MRHSEEAFNRHAHGVEAEADVEEHVGQQDEDRQVAGHAVEAALEVLRDGTDPREVDDRQPAEDEVGD